LEEKIKNTAETSPEKIPLKRKGSLQGASKFEGGGEKPYPKAEAEQAP